MAHKAHEGYSGKNPVPKVALRSLFDPSGATESKAKGLFGTTKREKEQEDETQHVNRQMVKGKEVAVKDPVTGEETTVKHGAEEEETAGKGENVLSMLLPPPDWNAYKRRVVELTQAAILKIIAAYVLFPAMFSLPLVTNSARSLIHSHPLIAFFILFFFALAPPTAFAYVMLFALHKQADEDFSDRAWDSERKRGLAAGEDRDGDGNTRGEERIKESAEWLNAVLRGVWPIVNPELFTSAVDMLEDIMQSSAPKFVHSVRVADLGQGTNAMRITSLRSLPDGDIEEALDGADDGVKERLKRDHINLEISYSYRALPSGATAKSKAHNAHLLIEFFLGARGVWQFPLPVWVELTGASGTARARLELIPDPPFFKTSLVTLMGLPRVSIAVVPMSRSLPNVMNIPFISSFISSSIDAACAEYVAPRSLTLDLQQLISGDDIKKDTEAIGILVVHIHRAIGIKKMDNNGSSAHDGETGSADAYVTVVYSRQAKPLYSTRVIMADINPVFEETAIITVDANAVKVQENLCLQLWDSDRTTADDMLGYVEVDVLELLRADAKPTRKLVPLGSPDSKERPGDLEFTVGYYSKMAPNSALATDGADPAIPEDLKQKNPEFREAHAVALNDLEAAILVTPPDPDWPSGILSVQVHEIRDLNVRMEGKEKSLLGSGRKEGEKGQDEDAEQREEGEDLPSSYCTISINDNLVYATRVKPVTSTPTFNAGTERFIRDWRTTHVNVVVRDSRMRESDPILGIMFLKLSNLLVNASEVTRFFPLENGIGYGSARISVLFRPVRATLPKNLLGFDTGTLIIRDITARAMDSQDEQLKSLQGCELRLKTSAGAMKVSRKKADNSQDGNIVWHTEDSPTKLPVQQRYSSALIVKFKSTTGMSSSKRAMAVLWLRDIIDNEEQAVDVPLWKADDYAKLRQNYVPLDGSLDAWGDEKTKLTRIGTLRLQATFDPGLSDAHKDTMDKSDTSKKRLWEEVERRDDAGLRSKVGEKASGARQSSSGDGNTLVGENHVEVEERGPDSDHSEEGTDGTEDGEADSSSDDDGKGLMAKLKRWKQHEKELHQHHRGAMQVKPMRTAAWVKDNVEEAGHKVKGRFKMKTRQPDVETEV